VQRGHASASGDRTIGWPRARPDTRLSWRTCCSRASPITSEPVTVIQQLDLRIEDREFLVLVGPSGCGKSTVLRLIAGLEELTAGTIRIGGRA
jgi:ABC-type nitrate/sulfonate/bicarbonate transport system ATPase subunit